MNYSKMTIALALLSGLVLPALMGCGRCPLSPGSVAAKAPSVVLLTLPALDEHELTTDTRLLGEWRTAAFPARRMQVRWLRETDKTGRVQESHAVYQLLVRSASSFGHSGDRMTTLSAGLVGPYMLTDLPVRAEHDNYYVASHVNACGRVFRWHLTDKELRLDELDRKWLAAFLKKHPTRLSHRRLADGMYVVTASEQELREFLDQFQAEAFRPGLRFIKVK